MYTKISQLVNQVEEEVTLKGWVCNQRSSGKITFLQLRDGSGFVQAIVSQNEVPQPVWDTAQNLTQESSVEILGRVSKHPKKEEYEIQVQDIKVMQLAQNYPIGKKEHGPDFLFENRHLYLRSKTPWAILRIRDEITWRIEEFLHQEGFTRTDTPIFQPTSCEDTTQLYKVDYFGNTVYLTQSGQLYLEAIEHGLGRVYDFGPAFRAEKSKTRKHLTEFWMMDWEAPFFDQQQSEDFTEQMLQYVIGCVLKNRQQELAILGRDTTTLEKAAKTPFVRLKLRDAIKLLNTEHGFNLQSEDDLNTEAEEKIGEIYGVPVFVEDYPYAVKAFYMKRYTDEDGVERGYCADLIAPEGGGEIATAAVRENDYDKLVKNLKERKYRMEDYQWYLDLRKYGSIVHAGGGIGLERWVRWICGVKHIRETIPFPRMINRITP
ncbi:MAG: asparagine--tRNA ligase [Candidatus Kerfeldbacteria bacterium RIFOXYA2_FULL_38_24]|uniref:Asparagine--tRNA ligase n=1 Tax=Candidatus Kerfeldbacteria bacterium RIFOXYB2_FULL_38_14 TaxID=1798547 RepID=A0A1G2BEU3_9BACT|nr:MAG: asparagine--tRNA ligase [Candidatus Kerfeldbacteria bacterium RIFOXYB2_FULL_38_14]OGY87953.1 MAG: asparagine--tRNA ligase [Candidatus Kerfeldbacteria bacterium RIFOXYA2_FULL_38_24]